MNICYPGNCICDAAEWEGDADCFGMVVGGYVNEFQVPTPTKPPAREKYEYREPRRVYVDNVVDRSTLPEISIKKFMRGGVKASPKQRTCIYSLLDDKIIPDASRKLIDDSAEWLPARDAGKVIDYLRSLPYKTNRYWA